MIGISKLYCGTVEPSDALRYGRMSSQLPSHLLQFSSDKRPVVVWNITRRCNLKCLHCYAHARNIPFDNELTTREGKKLIDDLAGFGVPVLLISGGEPLARKDLPELAAYAVEKGMRAVISTNGTLITPQMAGTLKNIGLSYVGISLDGMEEINDRFRGVKGAFRSALKGIENCKKAGIKVGLRFTINKINVGEIPDLFKLIEENDIPRICFYHLVYAGRGSKLVEEDLSHEESRRAVDLIMDFTKKLHDQGKPKEVLTVD
ncbi:MAG: radical SAM protein, partial [Deltaproteobacteria bacterium]|nr:radical SAM protein [Deltaproteobacteria bacterium]